MPASPAPPPAPSAWPTGPPDAVRLQGLGRAVRARASCSTSPRRPRRSGFDIVAVSDHFQPWRHHGGHSPERAAVARRRRPGDASASCSARASSRRRCATTRRSSRRRSARSAASRPGRVFLGVGTGEAMNETPVTGGEWPGAQGAPAAPRRGDRADPPALDRGARRLRGRVLPHASAPRSTTARTQPVPIYVAASGPLAAKLAGRVGDGFICTSGKKPELYERADRRRRGGRRGGRPRPRRDRAHDRDQGLLRPRRRVRALTQLRTGGPRSR